MKTPHIILRLMVIALLLGLQTSHAQANRNALDRRVVIQEKEIRFDSLLQLFSRQTGLEFSFNSHKIPLSRKVTVNKKNQSVAQWLSQIQKNFGIQYRLVGNHLILKERVKWPDKGAKKQPPVSHRQTTGAKKSQRPLMGKHPDAPQKDQPTAASQQSPPPQRKRASQAQPREQKETDVTRPNSTTLPAGPAEQVRSTASPAEQHAPANSGDNSPIRREQDGITGRESVRLLLGFSKHGSGDMKGVVFGTEYARSMSDKFSLGLLLAGSINSDRHAIMVENQVSGQKIDASVRFTTAGVQLGPLARWHIVRSARHDLSLGLGVFGRYQSASNGSDGYAVYMPQTTGAPTVLIGYQNRTPQHTVAFGGLLQVGYSFALGRAFTFGVFAGFQTDTNGDALPQAGLVLGRKWIH